MRKTYGLAVVREYDVKAFAYYFTLADAEKALGLVSRKTNSTLVVVNMESVNV